MRIRPVSAFCAALGLLLGAACSKPSVETVVAREAVAVAVQPVRIDSIRSVVVATGTISPSTAGDWTITAPESATIAELPKNEGDEVKTGDLLVRFDIPGLAADVTARHAELAAANARATTTKATADRLSGLADRGIAARKDVLAAQQEFTDAQEAVKMATIASSAAETAADRANVRARFAGVVAKRWHNVGDKVDSTEADPVLRLIDPSHAEVIASVPPADVGRVWIGRPAQVTDPASHLVESGNVSSLPTTAEGSSAATELRVKFAAPTHMPIGTPVSVEILVDERANVLVIPAAAVGHDGDEVFVMVAGSDNKAHKHVVRLGLATRELVEVADGLKIDDPVIVRGQDGLTDGATITIAK